MFLYIHIIRPLLFLFHPDYIHAICIQIGKRIQSWSVMRRIVHYLWAPKKDPSLEVSLWGRKYSHPIGLAAGFDKNGDIITLLDAVGFGHIEIGAITAGAYKGNPRPWTTRVVKDKSLLVNYGLKNDGVDVIVKKIQSSSYTVPLIANIAKTNDARIQGKETVREYIRAIEKVAPYVDSIDINISCPNTGDGALLCEDMELLEMLLAAIAAIRATITPPLLLKIKPDISENKVQALVDLVDRYNCIDGFVATNLSRNRDLLSQKDQVAHIPGGISGKPIGADATKMIRMLYHHTQGRYPIIGCGGVWDGKDAYEKIRAGASLIQVLTGCIYQGPGIIKKIHKELKDLLIRDGYHSIQDVVGIDTKNNPLA